MRGNTFQQKTVRGIGWSGVSQIGRQGIYYVIFIVLARILSPEEFGLVAMITVITSFATIFAEMGFSAALIQKQDIQQNELSSVFWLNVAAGIGLTGIFVAGAPLIARFYDEPILLPLTILIAANFTVGSLTIVQKTIRTKKLDFRSLSIADITAEILSGTVAIFLAYMGAGVWSLAIRSVLLTTIVSIILWRLGGWRPAFIFEWKALKNLFGFSLNHLGTQLLNYWVQNLDYLLIGRTIGPQPLGIYRNAYTVMLLPLANVSRVISRVMFPSLALIQDDKARVRHLFLRMTRTIALVTFPMMVGLFVVSEPFVLAVFGDQWSPMIPVLRVFCLTGLLKSVGTLTGNLYLSQGRSDLQLRVGLLVHTIAMISIVIGLQWGILGVAIGLTVATILNSYPSLYYAGRLVNLTFWQVWRTLLNVLFVALVMGVGVWAIGFFLTEEWPHWLQLAAQIVAGVTLYGVMLHLFRVRAYVEARDLFTAQVRQLRSRRSSEGVQE